VSCYLSEVNDLDHNVPSSLHLRDAYGVTYLPYLSNRIPRGQRVRKIWLLNIRWLGSQIQIPAHVEEVQLTYDTSTQALA